VVRCVRREQTITLQFHPDAPIEVDTLLALVQKEKKRFRLSQDFQLTFIATATDWDGIVGEIKAVLGRVGSS
jgi:transcription-repair coupling factor (superfamily II helicase)